MSWTFCTSGAAIAKAGLNANSSIIASGGALAKWSDEAEGKIQAECHTDFITSWASMDSGTKNAIGDVASSLIAMNIVSYDPTGYLTREADMLMNVNDDRVGKGLAVIKEKQNQKLGTWS